MPITPVIEPATHPAIRAKLPRTFKKASIPIPTLILLQRTIKQYQQRYYML
jgi:hypothetical protein